MIYIENDQNIAPLFYFNMNKTRNLFRRGFKIAEHFESWFL